LEGGAIRLADDQGRVVGRSADRSEDEGAGAGAKKGEAQPCEHSSGHGDSFPVIGLPQEVPAIVTPHAPGKEDGRSD
jgi:hypothetical protein